MTRLICLIVFMLPTVAIAQTFEDISEWERLNQYKGPGVTASGSYFYDILNHRGFGDWEAPYSKTLEAIQATQLPIARNRGDEFVWAVAMVEKFDATSEYKFFDNKQDAIKYAKGLLDQWPLPKNYKRKRHHVYNLVIKPGKHGAATTILGPANR